MGHFPLFLNLTNKPVLLVGRGPQTDAKQEKLLPFGPDLRRLDHLTEADLSPRPVLVLAGDLSPAESRQVSTLCQAHGIPVNVADQPNLCTFFFPALVTRGPLTIGVSTAGTSPAMAAVLRQAIETNLPDQTEEILTWANTLRGKLPAPTLKAALTAALAQNRSLTVEETASILNAQSQYHS